MATLTPEMTNFLWGFCHEQAHELFDGPFHQAVPREQRRAEICILMTTVGCLGYFDGTKTPEGYPPAKVDWPFEEVSVQELLDALVPEHIKKQGREKNV